MTQIEFNLLVENVCVQMRGVLAAKGHKYARGDRLSNFKVAARFLECTPEAALLGMLMKHLVSIRDLIQDIDRESVADFQGAEPAVWSEKIGDAINYLVLLRGLVMERQKQHELFNPSRPIAASSGKRRA